MRLSDRRLAAAVPPALEELLAAEGSVEVGLVLLDGDGRQGDSGATATVVRSGRAWTEARGRLREQRGWARRLVRSPAEVVVLTPTG